MQLHALSHVKLDSRTETIASFLTGVNGSMFETVTGKLVRRADDVSSSLLQRSR